VSRRPRFLLAVARGRNDVRVGGDVAVGADEAAGSKSDILHVVGEDLAIRSLKPDLTGGTVNDTDHRGFAVHRQPFSVRHRTHDEPGLHREQRDGEKKRAYRNKKHSAHGKGSLGKWILVSSQTVKALMKTTGSVECFYGNSGRKSIKNQARFTLGFTGLRVP